MEFKQIVRICAILRDLSQAGTFSFFENEITLDFHHEKGQQMENNIGTGRRVVLEAHTGHQVNEEGIASLSELRVLTDREPASHKKVQICINADSSRGLEETAK